MNGSMEPYVNDHEHISFNNNTRQLLLTCLDADITKRYPDFKDLIKFIFHRIAGFDQDYES